MAFLFSHHRDRHQLNGFFKENRLVYQGPEQPEPPSSFEVREQSADQTGMEAPVDYENPEAAETKCVLQAEASQFQGDGECVASMQNLRQLESPSFSEPGMEEAMKTMAPEDIAVVKDSMMPDTHMNRFVKLLTGQKKLEGYQRVLLAPANAIESTVKLPVHLVEAGVSMVKSMGSVDSSQFDGAGKVVWEIIKNHMTWAEKTAIAVQIGGEAVTGAGLMAYVGKIAKIVAKIPRIAQAIERATQAVSSVIKTGSKITPLQAKAMKIAAKAYKVGKPVLQAKPIKGAVKAYKFGVKPAVSIKDKGEEALARKISTDESTSGEQEKGEETQNPEETVG